MFATRADANVIRQGPPLVVLSCHTAASRVGINIQPMFMYREVGHAGVQIYRQSLLTTTELACQHKHNKPPVRNIH